MVVIVTRIPPMMASPSMGKGGSGVYDSCVAHCYRP